MSNATPTPELIKQLTQSQIRVLRRQKLRDDKIAYLHVNQFGIATIQLVNDRLGLFLHMEVSKRGKVYQIVRRFAR